MLVLSTGSSSPAEESGPGDEANVLTFVYIFSSMMRSG